MWDWALEMAQQGDGEGALLRDLVTPLEPAVLERLRGALSWHDVVATDGSDEERLALARDTRIVSPPASRTADRG